MRILDKYILRSILWPTLFCIYTLVLLFLISDVFDNLSEILRNKTPLMTVFRYYCLLVPFAFSQIISWSVFLGTIYIFTTFNRHNELIAMKAAGLEIFSIIKPLLFLGFCFSIASFIINDRIVPPTFKQAQEIKKIYIQKNGSEQESSDPEQVENITLIKGNKQFFIKSMNPITFEIRDVRIHYLGDNYSVTKKIAAKRGDWDGEKWTLSIVQIFELGSDRKIIGEPVFLPKYPFTEVKVTPEDLEKAGDHSPLKTMKEIKELIGVLKENGLDYYSELTDLYERFAASWMNLIIILIILPLLGQSYIRQGMGSKVIACLGLVFCYHLINAISVAFGKSGTLPPLVGVWLPHFAFGFAGIWFMRRANY